MGEAYSVSAWVGFGTLFVSVAVAAATGVWLARRYPTLAIPLAIPIAVVGAFIQAEVVRPSGAAHSFEKSFVGAFVPPAIAFLAAMWVGSVMARDDFPVEACVLCGALVAVILEVVAAFFMFFAVLG